MGKHDRLSRDQKRKAKLKKRSERTHQHESLAYAGKKYKTDELVPVFYRTERGIYESYVMCDRELIDDEVEAAVERLVIRMREGPLPPLAQTDVITITEGGEEDFVIENIRRQWRILEAEGALPRQDDLVGILRSILHSIKIWRSQSLHSRGYLHYIEGFMKNLGVSIRKATPELKPLPEPDEDPLLLIGRTWVVEGDQAAGAKFADGFESSLRGGETERVIDICQQLLGEHVEESVVPRLQEFVIRGRRALQAEMG